MSVLLIAGSPSKHSRTAALLDAAGHRIKLHETEVELLRVRDLPPQALLWADFGDPALVQATAQVAQSNFLVIATPVYKAAYSGLLKAFLDVLPQTALKGKTVLPLATGGSPHHMLALDYALRPVLQSLGAKHVLSGIYATDSQVVLHPQGGYHVDQEIQDRLDEAIEAWTGDDAASCKSRAPGWLSVRAAPERCPA